jgi:hypothetical protein
MRTLVLRAALGLSIIAGSLAAAAPANATVWKNFKDLTKCLGVQGASGQVGTQIITYTCNGSADQNWTEQFFPLSLGYNYYFTGQVRNNTDPPLRDMVLGVAGGVIGPSKDIIDWTTFSPAHGDQGWKKVYAVTDSAQHMCYYFLNYATPNNSTSVLGIAGFVPSNGTHVVVEELYKVPGTNNPDTGGHSEQYWCAY